MFVVCEIQNIHSTFRSAYGHTTPTKHE